MERLLKDFIGTVEKQNRVLDQLAELGQQKQELIVLGKVKELDNLIHKEGIVISNLEKLEGARFNLQEKLGNRWKVRKEEFSARKMLSLMVDSYPELHKELEQIIGRLDYNIARLKAINSHNDELINQSLDYISLMESVLNGDVAGTYSNKGIQSDEEKTRPRINILDKKV